MKLIITVLLLISFLLIMLVKKGYSTSHWFQNFKVKKAQPPPPPTHTDKLTKIKHAQTYMSKMYIGKNSS